MPREVYQTERLPVSYVEEEDVYVIQPPMDFEDGYKVNAAVTHFYEEDAEEPFDSYEMDFEESGLPSSEGLVVPEDPYQGCEFAMVFLYDPALDLPYATVEEEVREVEAVDEFDGRFSDVSVSYSPEEVADVDYLSVDVRDPASGEYVAGDVYRIDDPETQTGEDEALLQSTNHQLYPGDFAGYEAEIAYLAEEPAETASTE